MNHLWCLGLLHSFPPVFCWCSQWGHSDSRTPQSGATQTFQLQRIPRQDVLVWAYPARSASCYERKVQNTAFLFSFINLEILLNLKHSLGLGFLCTYKYDTTTRNTSMSHGMQTFSRGSDFNWTTSHSLFSRSHQSFIIRHLAYTELLRKISKSWAKVFFFQKYVCPIQCPRTSDTI